MSENTFFASKEDMQTKLFFHALSAVGYLLMLWGTSIPVTVDLISVCVLGVSLYAFGAVLDHEQPTLVGSLEGRLFRTSTFVVTMGLFVAGFWQGATTLGMATLMSHLLAMQVHELVYHYG